MKVDEIVKAFAALVVAVIAALVTALGTGATDFSDLDNQTWLVALGSVLASGALVFWLENIPGVAGGVVKAIVGGLAPAVAALVVALDDKVLSQVEQLTAISAFVVGFSAVYQLKNAEPANP